MNKNVLIVAGVVLALFLSLPILAKLKTGAEGGGATVESGAAPDAAAAPLLPPALNAGNLAGSAWNVKGITVQLGAGGVATANTPIGAMSGEWSVDGATLTVKAAGREVKAQISGDQLLVDGQPAQRVQ